MITPEIVAYAFFDKVLTPITKKDGTTVERKTPLYIMAEYFGEWAFDDLKNRKGELKVNLISSDQNPYRKHDITSPAYFVQCRPAGCPTYNLSGLRAAQMAEPDVYTYSGEPYAAPTLKNGTANPLYRCRNDGFVFRLSKDKKTLELWVLGGQRAIIDSYRNAFVLGTYDAALDAIRKSAKLC